MDIEVSDILTNICSINYEMSRRRHLPTIEDEESINPSIACKSQQRERKEKELAQSLFELHAKVYMLTRLSKSIIT